MMRRIVIHLSSVNKNFAKTFLNIRNTAVTTTEVATDKSIPALITEVIFSFSPFARYFVISLETVTGMPEEEKVISVANTVRAT